MAGNRRRDKVTALLGGTGLALMAAGYGFGEPNLNQVLAGARVLPANRDGCLSIEIAFNFRVGYISHFPQISGSDLRVKIRPLDRDSISENLLAKRESVQTPRLPGAEIRGIFFEANGSGPVLTIFFAKPVVYKVTQGTDFSSISVTVAGEDATAQCRASITGEPAATATPDDGGPVQAIDDVPLPPSVAETEPDTGTPATAKIETSMADARRAIITKDYDRAVQLLTRLIAAPPHRYSADAQELLGVVRERNGQFAHAKAEYRIYLEKYPEGEGADRVRQRLAAIATAEAAAPGKLRKASGAQAASGGAATGGGARRTAGRRRAARDSGEGAGDPNAFRTETSGSVSLYYYYNGGSTQLTELASKQTSTDDDVFQNSVLSSIYLNGSAENKFYRFKWRFSGSYEMDFNGGPGDVRVSSAYVEGEHKELNATARVGRQTRNSDGIFGRFDGALFTWKPRERTAVNLAVGSPVDSSADAPAKDDRYFVSASADLEDIADRVDLTVYGIEQRAGSLVDRRAVGAEVQYIDDRRSFFGAIDYDLYYKRISSLVVSGSITNPDSSTISARADYVHSPGLVTTNALQGQAANTLDQLLQTFSVSQISELALDRTAETASLNVTYSRPLDEKTQLTVDGTLYHTGGNPASGGVAAVPAPGLEFFASAQLVRSDIFRKGDVASATLRYANTVSTDLYLLDVYSRYPVSKKLRLRPRIKLGYRNLKTAGGSEVFVIPSMTANYQFTKTTSFELELSSLWSSRKTGTTRESSNEIGIVAGYRVEF